MSLGLPPIERRWATVGRGFTPLQVLTRHPTVLLVRDGETEKKAIYGKYLYLTVMAGDKGGA